MAWRIIGVLCCFSIVSAAGAEEWSFRHHFVDNNLPGNSWGQTALVDIDGDGDLDFFTGQRDGEVRWYEFKPGWTWEMHVIGENSPSDVGADVLDVDGDGRLDFVAGGVWYRQPEDPRAGPWERIVFDEQLSHVHDLITADVDGDGVIDVITMSDRNDLRWYRIPGDPTQPWEKTSIGRAVHAGIAAGDIDGDGDIDLVRSGYWLENLGDGSEWTEHLFSPIPWADYDQWREAAKAEIADINGDGRPDVVLTEAEEPGGQIAWFEAPEDPRQTPWEMHMIPFGDDLRRGPFHSLQVIDVDGDGDLDIFSVEMEWLGEPPFRWFVWENVNGDGSEFRERVIFDGDLGGHEALAGDIDGDGDVDFIGKLWRPVEQNANQGRNHVSSLENAGG